MLELKMGYNAMTDKYENLVESGVIDPAKQLDSVKPSILIKHK
ncbi:putative groEL-like equatorial domain superfamily [Helianthus debilis subsp. tardiflorus]